MQLQIRTLLKQVHPLKGVVYASIQLVPCKGAAADRIEVRVAPRKNSRACCCRCGRPGATYDHQRERRFDFVPLWVCLSSYCMPRVAWIAATVACTSKPCLGPGASRR